MLVRWLAGAMSSVVRQGRKNRGQLLFSMMGIGALFLFLPSTLSVYAVRSPSLPNLPAAQSSSIGHASTFPVVDVTEDEKAMGYPDGRKVVRDQQGALYIAYRKKHKVGFHTAYHIFVAKSSDNGHSWQVLNQGKPIEDVGDQNQRVPAIAIDQHGVIHVVWYGKDGFDFKSDENQIKYVSSTDQGQTWSAWRNIAYVPGYLDQKSWQEHPAIYIDQNNVLYVVWEGYDATSPTLTQIKFLRSTDGGESWSLWRNVASSSVDLSRPTVVGHGNDTLYIFAYGRVASRHQIIYAQSTDGGLTWSDWARPAPTLLEQRHVSAAVGDHGTLHVVWTQQPFSLRALLPWSKGQANSAIYYTTLDDTGWSSPTRIQVGHGGAQAFPSISVDTVAVLDPITGQQELVDSVWIVWSESRGSDGAQGNDYESTIYVARNNGSGWDVPTLISTGGLYPSLARVTGQGSSHRRDIVNDRHDLNRTASHEASADLVWLERKETFNMIRFAHLTDRQRPLQEASVVSARMIGVQSMQPIPDSLLKIQKMEFLPLASDWLLQILWPWQQLTREAQTLLFILFALIGYVLLKFVVATIVERYTN